jgi:hypothetical protein
MTLISGSPESRSNYRKNWRNIFTTSSSSWEFISKINPHPLATVGLTASKKYMKHLHNEPYNALVIY